jgi:hypothetical protein
MSSTMAGSPALAGVAPSSWGALDRITRYLYGELGPQRGPGGAGLARPRALLRELGDPQDGFRAVHVAGTAGKGSVSTLVASVLQTHGFRVGAHLSPHAYCLLERFQLDGRPAAAELVEAEVARIRPAVAAPARVVTPRRPSSRSRTPSPSACSRAGWTTASSRPGSAGCSTPPTRSRGPTSSPSSPRGRDSRSWSAALPTCSPPCAWGPRRGDAPQHLPGGLGAPTASAPGPPSGARPRTGCWSRSDRRRSSTSWLRLERARMPADGRSGTSPTRPPSRRTPASSPSDTAHGRRPDP